MLGLYFNMHDRVCLWITKRAQASRRARKNPKTLFSGTPADCAAFMQRYAAQNDFRLISAAYTKREEGD